jgi:hypothetical protein
MKNLPVVESEVKLWPKIKTKIRYGLILQSLRSVLMRFGLEITPFYIFREDTRLTDETPEISGSADYAIEELGRDDMKVIGTVYKALPEKRCIDLLEAGEKCIALKYKGEIASFVWINFKALTYGSTVMYLKSNEVYMWFGYTMIPYRGKNLITYLRYKTFEMLNRMNINAIYSVSDCFNSPAVRCQKKLKAKKVKAVLYLNLLKKIRKSYTLKTY